MLDNNNNKNKAYNLFAICVYALNGTKRVIVYQSKANTFFKLSKLFCAIEKLALLCQVLQELFCKVKRALFYCNKMDFACSYMKE